MAVKVESYTVVKYDESLNPAKVLECRVGEYYCYSTNKSETDLWNLPDEHGLLW